MYKTFFILITIFLVFITVFLCISNPKMHKTVFVYDSAYEVVTPQKNVEVVKTMPTKTVTTKQVKVAEPVPQTKVVKKQTTPKVTKTVAPKTVKTVSAPQKTVTKKIAPVQKQTVPKQVAQKQQSQRSQTASSPQPKPISEAEQARQEEILWNKWRSTLQNKIMSDSKLPIVPQGTIFRFSFNVDKYGKITNVQTWSQTPSYTPYAIQYIAPVIRSLQGRSILNFPAGSNRVSTTVSGAWKISQTAKYSTSADFNDSERVTK